MKPLVIEWNKKALAFDLFQEDDGGEILNHVVCSDIDDILREVREYMERHFNDPKTWDGVAECA